MKRLVLLFLLTCLVTSYCLAQSPGELTGSKASKGSRPSTGSEKVGRPKVVKTIAVTFISNDTCSLMIDDKDYGDFVNNKILKLQLGNYRLFFENLETGETITKRSFRLNTDSLPVGRYTFSINFKHQH